MKIARYIFSNIASRIVALALCVFAAFGFSACSDDTADIYADVEMLLAAPDGELIQIVRPDNGQATTFLRDINNNRVYAIPSFIDNRATVRVEKGVYVMAFDGEAVMPDGTVRRVRMTGHSVIKDALTFNEAKVTITLNIFFL